MRAKNIWKKDVDSSVGSCGGRRHVLSVLDVQLLQASVTASSLPRSYKVCGVCVCVCQAWELASSESTTGCSYIKKC